VTIHAQQSINSTDANLGVIDARQIQKRLMTPAMPVTQPVSRDAKGRDMPLAPMLTCPMLNASDPANSS